MSRSALWRQEANVQDRARHAEETFTRVLSEGRDIHAHKKGVLPLMGPDDTFNIHPVILSSVEKSPYFINKCCEKLMDWNMVVDEIYYEVKHLEPWTAVLTQSHYILYFSHNSKSPSTAYCLLLRLFTLRCTEKQMTLMLEHVDSPYIRCIGFLYLRYAADPSTLWSWFEPYLYDEELVQVRQGKGDITVGEYCRLLLSELDYYGTRFPRLPIAIERQFKVKLLQAERSEERAKQHLENEAAMQYFQKTGARVMALYGDDENPITWYDAVVDRVILRDLESGEMLSRPKFQVTFPEYGNTEVVTLGEMDLPGTHTTNTTSEGADESGRGRGGEPNKPDYSSSAAYHDERRGGDRGYNRDGRGRSNDYHRGNNDNYRGRDSRRDHYDYRGGGNTPHGQRGYGDRRSFDDHRRERSRSRDRNDARREENDLMEEVLRREREKSAAKGRRDYASRPAAFRGESDERIQNRRHMDRDASDRRQQTRETPKVDEVKATESQKPAAAPVREKTAAELAAIQEKKMKLMAKYG